MKLIAKLSLVAAIAVLAGCSPYSNNAPSWMPGSNAIKVKLTGTEEVPPLSVSGSGEGTFRVAEDGTVSGNITTKDVAGTMAHIHRVAGGAPGALRLHPRYCSAKSALPRPQGTRCRTRTTRAPRLQPASG